MILMNDFLAEPEQLKSAVTARLSAAVQSGWYILGKEVDGFENEWASVCGSDYAIGVANGMDAIEIILRSLDIGKGDEVITTPMTAFATILAIYQQVRPPFLLILIGDWAYFNWQLCQVYF